MHEIVFDNTVENLEKSPSKIDRRKSNELKKMSNKQIKHMKDF